jgi:hypothetical protein
VPSKEHPDTLTSMNNLAGTLRYQGNYEQAEEMHQQTLGLSERALGKEHPSTLMSMNKPSGRTEGKYGQAEDMHR